MWKNLIWWGSQGIHGLGSEIHSVVAVTPFISKLMHESCQLEFVGLFIFQRFQICF